MALLDLTLSRLAMLNHTLVMYSGGRLQCSCGWKYVLATGETQTVAGLGHLAAVSMGRGGTNSNA